jgi:hypothetical protein
MPSRATLLPIPKTRKVEADDVNAIYAILNGSYSNTRGPITETTTRGLGMSVKLTGFDGKMSTGLIDTASYALDVRNREGTQQRALAVRNAANKIVFEVRGGLPYAVIDTLNGTPTTQVMAFTQPAGGVLSGTYPNPGFYLSTEYFRVYPKMIVPWFGSIATTLIGGNLELQAAPGWVLCNGATVTMRDGSSVTVPNMTNRFAYGAGGDQAIGATFGNSLATLAALATSHVHTGAVHTHSHDHTHTHTIAAHDHTLNSHTHDLNNHYHDLGFHTHNFTYVHTHDLSAHTHDIHFHFHDISHTHQYVHTHNTGAHTHDLSSHNHGPNTLFIVSGAGTTNTDAVNVSTINNPASGGSPIPVSLSGHRHTFPNANLGVGGGVTAGPSTNTTDATAGFGPTTTTNTQSATTTTTQSPATSGFTNANPEPTGAPSSNTTGAVSPSSSGTTANNAVQNTGIPQPTNSSGLPSTANTSQQPISSTISQSSATDSTTSSVSNTGSAGPTLNATPTGLALYWIFKL